MTDSSLFDRLLADVLDDWPTVAPTRLTTLIYSGVETTPQRRRRMFMPGWRRPKSYRSLLPLAAGLTLVFVAGVATFDRLATRPGTSGPAATESPNPSMTPTRVAPLGVVGSGQTVPLHAGRYQMPEPNTDGAGTWPVGRLILTVPEGWTQVSTWRGGGIRKGDAGTAGASVAFGRLGVLEIGPEDCSPMDHEPGPAVKDLVAMLAASTDIVVDDLVVGRYGGKRIELAFDGGCQAFMGWSTPRGGEQWRYSWSQGWHHQLSILDIDGVRFVIDASYPLDASPDLIAEVQDIVDSIELE